jgi:hypothetical protein
MMGALKTSYTEYLRSPEWKARRAAALAKAGHRCQLCNRAKRLQVHHRTYERIGQEAPSDLTVLCADCHEHFHGIKGGTKRATAPTSRKPKKQVVRVPASPRKPQRPTSPRKAAALEKVLAVIAEAPVSATKYTTSEVADLAGITPNEAGMALNWCHADPDVRCRRASRGVWRLRRI